MKKGRVLTRNRPKILNINTLPDRIQIRRTYANVGVHAGNPDVIKYNTNTHIYIIDQYLSSILMI